jgi:hypothetical protein
MRVFNSLLTTIGLILCVVAVYIIFQFIPALHLEYPSKADVVPTVSPNPIVSPQVVAPVVPVVTHIKTPKAVKAIYMTSFVAGEKKLREGLVKIIDDTEINSVIIDIKDYTGEIAFKLERPELLELATIDNRIPDIRSFLADLHKRGIYIIARIAAFQDPALVKKKPELAVTELKDKKKVWKDRKGQTWTDPGSKEVWHYLVSLSKEAYAIGFDEINFDYIRFPSDGDMSNIYYPFSHDKVKSEVMKEFYAYIDTELKDTGVATSADLFGMTTTNVDDLNIGQILEDALQYFDYVAPMVYPSHYPTNFLGFKNPAEKPYEVIKYSMDKAFARASTSPGLLRPWLQDFSLGTVYTPAMVKAQIQAVYDSGLDSWMLWNASNRYTRSALLDE